MRIGVLALQGDVSSHRALLNDVIGPDDSVICVRRPDELGRVDALIVPGGESSVIDKLARRAGLFEPIRERIEAGMPCLGTCAGMILLADRVVSAIDGQQSFGGLDVTVRRNAFGRQVHSFEVDLQITGVTGPGDDFRAVFIRAPWVVETGPDVHTLAWAPDADGELRSVAVRAQHLLATAFHPELSGDNRLHRYFVEMARTIDTPDSRLRRAQRV